MKPHRRLSSWEDLSLVDLAYAYRKAKVDCFFERAISQSRDFAKYESDLAANLARLLKALTGDGSTRESLFREENLFGDLHLVAKKLRVDHDECSGRQGNQGAYISNKKQAFKSFCHSNELCAEFRITSRFSVDLHVLSGLWVNLVGHLFDACLSKSVYGSRVRRYGDDGGPSSKPYHLGAPGTMPPYFLAYRRWREDGLRAIQAALDSGDRIVALTMDVRSFFHRIDPSFVAKPSFHEVIGLARCSLESASHDEQTLTGAEVQFTELMVNALKSWSEFASRFISAAKTDSSEPIGGIPIGLTAGRVIANLLLHEWDRAVLERLSPIYYGRYVDDMFLVLRDPGNCYGRDALMGRIAGMLPQGMLIGPHEETGCREVRLGDYQGESEIILKDGKHRVFFLEGRSGLDLLEVIRKEIRELSSERRMMPDPGELTRSPAARVLAATGDARESADSLRRAEGLSIRRMGWAIQLRNAETLALDLDAAEWKSERGLFYRFARDHVLRPERLLDYVDYLPRLIGLAVCCRDWDIALTLVTEARDALVDLRTACSNSGGIRLNGYRVRGDDKRVWTGVIGAFEQLIQEAVLSAWPWEGQLGKLRPYPMTEENRGLVSELWPNGEDVQSIAQVLWSRDLARTPWRELRREFGPEPSERSSVVDSTSVYDCFPKQVEVIARFLREAEGLKHPQLEDASGGSGVFEENLLPYLFPTRPFSARDLAEFDPRCVDLGTTPTGPWEALRHWGEVVRAFRGIWTRIEPEAPDDLAPTQDDEPIRIVRVGIGRQDISPNVCVASLLTSDTAWSAAAHGKPLINLPRYVQFVRLTNAVLSTSPRPDYLLLPELSVPHRWVRSLANRLLAARISLIAGLEYEHDTPESVVSKAVLALTDDRLGFPSSVLLTQVKSAPAPKEEETLLRVHGKTWNPAKPRREVRVYRHRGFDFGVLICSELQEIRYRESLQGEVDCLFVLSWNKDLETFASLVESASLDVHSYVALVNNRQFGDSRVRCPAKERFGRDLCRIHGGLDDYAVVVGLDVTRLRRFQSRAKNWPTQDDPFKPVPQGFKIAERRRVIP